MLLGCFHNNELYSKFCFIFFIVTQSESWYLLRLLEHIKSIDFVIILYLITVVVVIISPLPRDRGTARTAI